MEDNNHNNGSFGEDNNASIRRTSPVRQNFSNNSDLRREVEDLERQADEAEHAAKEEREALERRKARARERLRRLGR